MAANPVAASLGAFHQPAYRDYHIVAMSIPISYNRYGDHDHNGLIFALERNYTELNKLNQPGEFRANEPHPLVRPLVLRATVGETVRVKLTNRIEEHRVGLHLVGGGYDVRKHDGARVGGNPDSTVPRDTGTNLGHSKTYYWRCDHEGVFVFHDGANFGGTEKDTNLHGLFGVLVVEPAGTVWRDSTGIVQRLSSSDEVDGLYVDVIPANRLHVPEPDKTPWLSAPRKQTGPTSAFREYVIVFHDEPEIDPPHSPLHDVTPPWEVEDPHEPHAGGHAGGHKEGPDGPAQVSHVMPVSYRAEPMHNREQIIWSRIRGLQIPGIPDHGPLDVPVVNEEQHHSSWMFGDPSTPILRAYLGDPVRIRLVHCGVKETHVYHLHVYEWYADPSNNTSPLIDAITISPQTGHTIELLWGAGNRQMVPGDVIWHCHLYPHFHLGMWGLFRTYDRLRNLDPATLTEDQRGSDGTASPEQRYPDGTLIPPLLPLPDRQAPPLPANAFDGWPRFMIENRPNADTLDPHDRAGREGQKSPRVPWIWPDPIPAGFDYRPPTDSERAFFLQHQGAAAQPGARLNTNPEPGWMAPYLAFAEPMSPRVQRDIEVLREPFDYNRHGWHDPRGHRFRLAGQDDWQGLDDAALQAGAAMEIDAEHPQEIQDPQGNPPPKRRQPLFFRVHHGDAVELTLHNRIAYPIPGDAYDHALPRPGVPGEWECGLHVHLVKFDVVCADGASSGWNYMSAPRPGYRLHYKWWADEEFGVIFTHDHLFANYRQKRGLSCGMLVEPAGSLWIDPGDPNGTGEIVAGEQAVIVRSDGTAFREIAIAVQDFVPLLGAAGEALNPPDEPTSDGDQGSMGVNYRSAPLRERPGDPSTWFASDGDSNRDPETPLLHAHANDPVWIRLLQGSHEEQHSFSVNGLRWRRFRDDPASPWQSQQTIGLSEAFTFKVNDDGTAPYGPGDYLWRFAGIDDTWLGCWGIFRVHPPGSGEIASLENAVTAASMTYNAPPALPTGPAAPVRSYTVVARQRRLVYRSDLIDRFGLVYEVRSMTTPNGKTVAYGSPSARAIAPLVLRCRTGEVVEITLVNALPDELEPEPSAPEVPIDREDPTQPRPVSSRVSLHADLVDIDVETSDGSHVGNNPDTTVGPGKSRTYVWAAGTELGPVPLYDLADVRNHRHHGLVGALIVEPADVTPVRPEHRWSTNVTPLARQAWTGPQAVIRTPDGQGPGTQGEEIVLVLQDGLRFFIHDNLALPFPDIPADPGEDAPDEEDQGQKAINYRSNPVGPPTWLAGSSAPVARFDVPRNADLRIHLVGGFDKPRNHSFTVHGFDWPEWPYRGAASPWISAEGGLSVNSVRTLRVTTGGSGDHAMRSGVVQHAISEGLWALLSVRGMQMEQIAGQLTDALSQALGGLGKADEP